MSFSSFPEQTAHSRRYLFRITIDADIVTGTNQGFVNHLNQKWYGANGGHSSTANNVIALERSNIRYEQLLICLSENITPVDILNIDNGSATANAIGTEFSFTVAYDRLDYLYTRNELFGSTHASAALEILTDPEEAIARQVCRAFVYDKVSQRELYDPDSGLDIWTSVTADMFATDSDDLETRIETVEPYISVTTLTTANP